jgi:hypothetical protein
VSRPTDRDVVAAWYGFARGDTSGWPTLLGWIETRTRSLQVRRTGGGLPKLRLLPSDSVEDAAASACLKIWEAAQGWNPADWDPEVRGVDGYMAVISRYVEVVLVNQATRATRRALESLDDPELAKNPGVVPVAVDERDWDAVPKAIASMRSRLEAELVPTRRRGRGEAILRDFDDMVAVFHDDKAIDELAVGTTNAAIHQRHTRARRDILLWLEDGLEDGTILEEDAAVYRAIHDRILRRRHGPS